MRNCILFFFFFFLNYSYSQNQDAIIYFNDGSSIEGFGMIKDEKILFKVSPDDKYDEWTNEIAKGIKFIGFDTESKFEFIKLDKNSKVFLLEVLSDGNVKLFVKFESKYTIENYFYSTLGYNNQKQEYTYYLKKGFEEFPKKLRDTNYIKMTSIYFHDCDALVNKIRNHEYRYETISKMVDYYNDICSN